MVERLLVQVPGAGDFRSQDVVEVCFGHIAQARILNDRRAMYDTAQWRHFALHAPYQPGNLIRIGDVDGKFVNRDAVLPQAPDAASALGRLRQDGVAGHEFTVDIADADQVARLIRRMQREMPPLRGIIHCAAVIQDSSLVNMTEANFHDVLRPKIAGAWNLHQETLDQKLDFFVMYSSATTLFGNEGQGNYVAANLYLEALADYRRGLGLPGLAVAWGAIGEVGHLAR